MLPSEVTLTIDRKTNRVFYVLQTQGVLDTSVVRKGALARDAIFYLVTQQYLQVSDYTGNLYSVASFRYIGS
ncbi:MAG: hypothetical protein OWT28_12960 [Firmicutes bacterium]|nr:hypothetical protein [Bacillota bacterium]